MEVGREATFDVEVVNRGDDAVTRLVVRDRFDPGLQHAMAQGEIERDLADLPPGGSQRFAVTFRVIRPGSLCQAIEVTSAGGARAETRYCVTAMVGGGVSPQPTSPPSLEPAPGSRPTMTPPDSSPPSILQPGAPAESRPSLTPRGATPPPSTSAPNTNTPPTFAPTPPATPAIVPQPAINVRKTGPKSKRVGEVAEFVITVTNTGNVPLTNLKITDNYEPSLEPVQVSDGYTTQGGAFVWNVENLEPGKALRRQVNCKCVQRVAKACNRVIVSCAELAQQSDESCLEVLPEPGAPAVEPSRPSTTAPPRSAPQPPPAAPGQVQGELSVAIAEQADPVRVGGESTYHIVVTNKSKSSDKQLVVSISVPKQLRIVSVGAPGATPSFAQREVRFSPIAEIRAGESITYELKVQAAEVGSAEVRVSVSTTGVPGGTSATETTQVLPR